MRNALKKIEFINCKRQAPNLGRILCKSSFSSGNSNSGVKNRGKTFACCQYIKEGIGHTSKTVSKNFEIRVAFNYGQTQTMLTEIFNTYRQYFRQPELQQIYVEGHISKCDGGYFLILPFFAVQDDNKILRESYETYFIEKLKPVLN